MTEKLYFLTSRHGNCGTNVMFHNKDECGDGTNIDNLQAYTAKESQRHHDSFGRDSLPLLIDKVKEKSFLSVDCQYIDSSMKAEASDISIIQIKNKWNGNDVFWISKYGSHTQDISKAKQFMPHELFDMQNDIDIDFNNKFIAYSYDKMYKIARRVFCERDINIRSMCRGVKIQRKKRESVGFKGYRGNCPVCGKFTYGSPYENEYCKDHDNAYDNPNYSGYQA